MAPAGADYYGVLVGVFQRELAGPAHAHLAAFHALVPALSLAAGKCMQHIYMLLACEREE